MPTVPVYGGQKVQTAITPNAQFNPNAPAEAFNLGASRDKLERAQGELVGTLGKIAKESIDKANKVRLLDFDSKLSQLQTRLEYGVNGQGGLYSKKGMDAVGAGELINQEWTKETDALLGELSNEEQKTMAKERVANRWANLNDSIQKHTFSELQKHDVQVTENFLKNSQNEAAENFTKPDRIAQNLNEQKEVLLDFGKWQGWDKETLDLKLAEAMNKTHALVISKFADSGLDSKAKEYYEAHKDEITGEAENQVLKMLKTSTLLGESQRAADQITLHAKGPAEALESARKIEDPEVRQATTKLIKENYENQRWSERMNAESMHKYAANILMKNGGNMKAIPNSMMSQFTTGERSALESYSKSLAKGKEPDMDWGKYTNLHNMATDPSTRQKFIDSNLMVEARPYVDDSHYDKLLSMQDGLRKGDSKTTYELDNAQGNQAIIDNSLKAIRVEKSGDEEEYNQANRMIYQRVNKWQVENNRKIPNDELYKMIDDIIKERVINKKGFFGGEKKKRAFELEEGEAFIDNAPKAQEVERSVKGRAAIFDANTKKFLRWK